MSTDEMVCLHELFEAHTARTPDAVALIYEQTQLTYYELNRRANQLAHHLRKLGVAAETRVALCLERGPEMIVGLLAILKAGGAYIPLDTSYPAARLAYMVENSAPRLLLTHSRIPKALRQEMLALVKGAQVPSLEIDTECWLQEPESEPDRRAIGLHPGHLAYVIYTSGSSGQPKGVMVTHANVLALFSGCRERLQFAPEDIWTLFHSIAFDVSVWELWGALLHGGSIVIVPHSVSRSPERFYELLCGVGVTVLCQTPSAFRPLIAAQAESGKAHELRYVLFAGEELDVTSLRPWYSRPRNQAARLCNLYGITETTVHATCRQLEPNDSERADHSIGCRLSHLSIYILDARGRPVPIGVTGELFIAGGGVARGYLNRPALTAERFVPDPFGASAGARMYRSGDLGRWQLDGTIDYLGRNDAQVKIRGFRVDPGEIQARLCEHAGVREAIVVARALTPTNRQLVAYYMARENASARDFPEPKSLRSHLLGILPPYMIPAAYVRVERWPMTPSGKLDKAALPAPGPSAHVTGEYEEPQGEVEVALARLWEELLEVERIGRRAHFFELGGDSLLATQLTARIRRDFDVDIALADIFAEPFIPAQAERVVAAQLARFSPEDLEGLIATALQP